MCGIVGWVGGPDKARLEAMAASVAHRGPDERGLWIGESASLAIARLSIIDVEAGHQPVYSDDLSVVCVFNGEIYNFQELARELMQDGVRLASGSDAEVIPHLYQKYGRDFVHRLRGMFAIAVWDKQSEELVLIRDRVGKKPLWYARGQNRLLFASEARALLAAGWRSQVDLGAIDHVLAFGYVPLSRGAFQGLHAVPPGHMAIVRGDRVHVERYWTWVPSAGKPRAEAELLTELETVLEEATRIRLISERPVGAFLSGGIDSTVVTALMARCSTEPVRTFSIGFTDKRFDESVHAERVAQYLGTQHTELIVEPDPSHLIERIASTFDQPFADSSAIPTLLVSELAAREVVVALAGDGGDEGFGGYVRYWAAPRLQTLNHLLRVGSLARPVISTLAGSTGSRTLERVSRGLVSRPSLEARYQAMMSWIPHYVRSDLWTNEAQYHFNINQASQEFTDQWRGLESAVPIDQMRAMDMATYLPGDLLTKVDIASMACSLEVRSPLLDQQVLEFAGSLPPDQLVHGRTTKVLLRKLAYSLVPRELLDRPKMGFAIPRADWLRGPLRDLTHDILLGASARKRGWFEIAEVERLLNAHNRGDDQDAKIWALLMVELWASNWVDQPSAKTSS